MATFKILGLIYLAINTVFMGPILYAVNKNRLKKREGMVWSFVFYALFMFLFWPLVILSSMGKEAIKGLKNTKKEDHE